MGQQVRTRKHGVVQYQANNQQFIPLTRGALFREMYLKLKGQLTVTLGNNTAANTNIGDEWACVKKIELVANGTDTLRSFTGAQLRVLNLFEFGNPPLVNSTIGDGATANPTFENVLIIPIWTPRLMRPFDTALDTRLLSDLRLVITWGDHTTINALATGFTANPTVDVWVMESAGYNGNFAIRRMAQNIYSPSGANSAYKVDFRPGPIYKGFYVNTQNVAGTTDSVTMLNNIKVQSGPTVFLDLDKETIRQTHRIREDIGFLYERALTTGTGAIGRFQQSSLSNLDSWYKINLCPDGYLSEAPDTVSFSEFSLVFDLAAACNLIIIPDEIFPVRNTAASSGSGSSRNRRAIGNGKKAA